MASGTPDCACSRPVPSDFGGHELLHLPDNKIIRRFHITPTQATINIINTVHNIASNEKNA